MPVSLMTNNFLSVWFTPFLENLLLSTGPANWAVGTSNSTKLNQSAFLLWESGIKMSDCGQLVLDTWVKVSRRTVSYTKIPDADTGKPSKRRLHQNMLRLWGEGRGSSWGLLNQPFLEREDGMKEDMGTTWERDEALPSETRSPQISSITSWCKVFWSRSRCLHSSLVKVTATSSNDTNA